MINQGTSTLLLIAAAIAPVAAAAIAGNLATIPNIPGWYAQLSKPSFNPPNWVFAPVWTTLYAMMAYAFYRVLGASSEWISFAVAIFLIQIALNASWSWVFFSLHSVHCASLACDCLNHRRVLADRSYGLDTTLALSVRAKRRLRC
jgi:tryptophan-rich sensory protein